MATIKLDSIAVDCPDPVALAKFYGELMDASYNDDSVQLDSFEVWFQQVENYQPPTWPTQERGQQVHFDFHTEDREAYVARAEALGATKVDVAERFTVMLDPAGHPFCICQSDDR